MSLHSIIEHRANYYFLKLEEDYVEICQGKHKHCKAAILSILENWMNSKRATASRESDLYVYLSYPQFVKQMFGLYERSTVITSLKELEQEGLILKRPFKDVFNQDTFEYRLNCPAVQQRLIMLPDKPSTVGSLNLNYPGVNLNDGSVETDGGSFENKRGGSVNLDDGSFKNKRNIEPTIESNIEPTENTEREVADATARSRTLSQDRSFQEQVVQVFGEYLVLNGINLKVKLPADEETEKREAIKPSQKEGAHVQNQTHSGNPGNSSQPHLDTNGHSRPLDASLTSQTKHRKDTNKVTEPPAPSKAHVNKSPFPVPKRVKPQSNIMDEISLTPDEQAVFDAWCSLFKVDVPLIPANAKASKQLVKPLQVWTGILDKSTAEVLKLIMNWAYKNDKNGYYKRGFKLYDAAREFEAWQSAQERPQGDKEDSNEHKVNKFYTLDALIERQNQWKTEGVTS